MKRFIFDMDGTLVKIDYSPENEYFYNIFKDDSKKLLDGIGVYIDSYEKAYNKYDVQKMSRYLSAVTGLEFTKEQSKLFRDAFFKAYPNLQKYYKMQENTCKDPTVGGASTIFGRFR